MESKNLVELQNKIHAQNVEMGWWDESRPFHVFVCLFHSELSEAMEGDRKGLMDDHLPNYPMFQVELADFVIRCLDWLGNVGHERYDYFTGLVDVSGNCAFICEMHSQVSSFVTTMKDPHYKNQEAPNAQLAFAVASCFEYAELQGFDLFQIINEKVEYNKHRADHKRENRKLEGGKKY